MIIQKQEEARRDDQDLLRLLGLKGERSKSLLTVDEQQQEAIKTLQRTLDSLLQGASGRQSPPNRHVKEIKMDRDFCERALDVSL